MHVDIYLKRPGKNFHTPDEFPVGLHGFENRKNWYFFRNEYKEAQKDGELRNKIVLIIMKIILPLSFITMKLLGCFIDFMISLINSGKLSKWCSLGCARSRSRLADLNQSERKDNGISLKTQFRINCKEYTKFEYD